jgi:acetyl-CoA synthetase (ADP-forming)
MTGIGGILAEAVADVAFRLAPITALDAEEMLDDLEGQALLGPVRGDAPVDRAAVTEVLLSLSRLVTERDDVVSVDVNPLLVDADGRPIAVDALVELRA